MLQLPDILYSLNIFVRNPIPMALLKKIESNFKWIDYIMTQKNIYRNSIIYPSSPLSIISTSK